MNNKPEKLLQHFKYDKCVQMCKDGWRVVREQEETTTYKTHALTGKKRSSIQKKNRYFLVNKFIYQSRLQSHCAFYSAQIYQKFLWPTQG
ncbi:MULTISPECIES: hypothetical protein [Providencia]|uniref:hypothetical protein n=1 Tax=Providencia TaxID=586 RepID=UPI0032DBB69C